LRLGSRLSGTQANTEKCGHGDQIFGMQKRCNAQKIINIQNQFIFTMPTLQGEKSKVRRDVRKKVQEFQTGAIVERDEEGRITREENSERGKDTY